MYQPRLANPGNGATTRPLPLCSNLGRSALPRKPTERVTNTVRMRFYFGLIAGLPPGVPGGGTTGMRSPEGGGVCFDLRIDPDRGRNDPARAA